ncbi:MAG: L,D-transpeptidase family protein [Candidatus Eiseniibacteriota bacterium]
MALPAGERTRDRAAALAIRALERPGAPFRELPPRLLVVDVERQRLSLVEGGTEIAVYPVSTAAAGIGGEEGSYRTPPGWHRVQARIGAGAPGGAVFEGRIATAEVWNGEPRADDLILTRILTLEGLEDGVNRGPGHDSLARYIYIHGTNHEGALGRPVSHGCVRVANAGMIDLFERISVGDPVVVAGREEAAHA